MGKLLRRRHDSSFNSRTREGCDLHYVSKKVKERVSIHAPARGAMPMPEDLPAAWEFQFTHPRGVRSDDQFRARIRLGFNSRTREGCDF